MILDILAEAKILKEYDLSSDIVDIFYGLEASHRGKNDLINILDKDKGIWFRVLDKSLGISLDKEKGLLSIYQIGSENSVKKDYNLEDIITIVGKPNPSNLWDKYQDYLTKDQYKALQKYVRVGVPQYFSKFEGLTQIIFGQQVSVNVANKQRCKFVELFGKKIYQDIYMYPKEEEIDITKLDSLNISEMKKRSLKEVVLFFLESKDIPWQDIRVLEDLRKIHGIGRWSCDWFALKALGRLEYIPKGDLKVRKLFCKFFSNDAYMNEDNLKDLEEKFYPFGGTLANQLLVLDSFSKLSGKT